jgi:hypothetical protein
MVAPHNILMLAFPNSQLLDVTGPPPDVCRRQLGVSPTGFRSRVRTKGRQKCRSSISALSSSPI